MPIPFFKSWFRSNKIHDESKFILLNSKEHVASGVFFTNGTHMLAGYQPKKQTPRITGIGGMKAENETLVDTAIRECLEELFNSGLLPSKLVPDIIKQIQPKDCYMNGKYGVVVYSFSDLETILNIVKKYNLPSNLYRKLPNKLPRTLKELVFEREYDPTAEIVSLSILPIEMYSMKHYILHKELIMDMKSFLERKSNK
jgi:hypothetical protein